MPDCSDLVSDLKLIASAARDLASSEEPSPRVWLADRGPIARRRADSGAGICDRPSANCSTASRRVGAAWWLAPLAAALLAAGAYVVSHKPAPHVAQHQPNAVQPSVRNIGSDISSDIGSRH